MDRLAQKCQGLEGCFHHVVRICRTQRFGQNVGNTSTFQNRTHGTSCNHSRTMSCGFDQHFGSAFFGQLVVWNSTMHHRNLNQVFLCIFNTFCDGFLYFFCFAQAMTHHSLFIAHHNQCREGKCTTALGSLHHTVDRNHFLFQFEVTCFYSV